MRMLVSLTLLHGRVERLGKMKPAVCPLCSLLWRFLFLKNPNLYLFAYHFPGQLYHCFDFSFFLLRKRLSIQTPT